MPSELTLTNWDLGGEPSAWAYLHVDELFPATEIRPRRRPAELDRAELTSIAQLPVQPGTSLEEYVASGPVSGIVVVLGGRIAFERYPRMCPGDRHLHVRRIHAGARLDLYRRREDDLPGYVTAAYGL